MIIGIVLLMLPIVEAMTCEYDSELYLTDKINFLCTLNGTYDYRCFTYVTTHDGYLINAYPYEENVKLFGVVDYFESSGSYVNVYFGKEDLYEGNNYIFNVVCASTNSASSYTDTFAVNITPSSVPIREPVYRAVWLKSQMSIIILIIILISLALTIYIFFKRALE